ncbi:MAG TPA: alpha/beta hydrolase [Micromonospora sp.]
MSDERARYRAVEEEAFAAYERGDLDGGVALLRAAMPELPGWRSDLAHFAACLLALRDRPAEALAELHTAYQAGGWWHRRILLDDGDLAGLRGLPGFADLVEGAHARAEAADPATRPPVVRRPAGPPRGLLLALHGAGEDAHDAAEAWGAAVDAGHLLVTIDSTQLNTPMYRSWPDPSVGLRDIAAALETLTPDELRLPRVAAGFSAGGRQALLWALAGTPHAPSRFVAVAPAVHSAQLGGLAAAVERGLTGVVVVGDRDDDVRDGALAAVRDLRAAGLPCRLDEVPGLGHAFPPDFDRRLPALLADGPRV